MDRIHKIIAKRTRYSRRAAEDLIREGRVLVNNVTAHIGDQADPEKDVIVLDGKPLSSAPPPEYILLNKPRGYLCTVSDPAGRPTVLDLVRTTVKVYPVGRLDYNTTGLVLLTNDGDMALRLTKAGEHCPKVYLVKVAGVPGEHLLDSLRKGITLEDGRLAPCEIETRRTKAGSYCWVKVTLYQGKNRQIRRMFEAIHHPVFQIRRIAIGPLTDAGLEIGEWRRLTGEEIALLRSDRVFDGPRSVKRERPLQRGFKKPTEERPAEPPAGRRPAAGERRPPLRPRSDATYPPSGKPGKEGGFGKTERKGARPPRPAGARRFERPESRDQSPAREERPAFPRDGRRRPRSQEQDEHRGEERTPRPAARQPFPREERKRPERSGERTFRGRPEKPSPRRAERRPGEDEGRAREGREDRPFRGRPEKPFPQRPERRSVDAEGRTREGREERPFRGRPEKPFPRRPESRPSGPDGRTRGEREERPGRPGNPRRPEFPAEGHERRPFQERPKSPRGKGVSEPRPPERSSRGERPEREFPSDGRRTRTEFRPSARKEHGHREGRPHGPRTQAPLRRGGKKR